MADTRKLFQYVGLFSVTVVIYAIYLKGIIDGRGQPPRNLSLGLIKLGFFAGAPFFIAAYFDSTWRSNDAAPIALCAWWAVYMFFVNKYGGGRPVAAALLFIPLTFSAFVAQGMGTFHHGA